MKNSNNIFGEKILENMAAMMEKVFSYMKFKSKCTSEPISKM